MTCLKCGGYDYDWTLCEKCDATAIAALKQVLAAPALAWTREKPIRRALTECRKAIEAATLDPADGRPGVVRQWFNQALFLKMIDEALLSIPEPSELPRSETDV